MPHFRPEQIKEIIRDTYSGLDPGSGSTAAMWYSVSDLNSLPRGAITYSLGTGNPVKHARLIPGEQVLDVGAGAGIDTVLAARAVGPGGRVVGLDITPEMLERARRHLQEAGLMNAELVQGAMEQIPLADAGFDAVITNGVLTLSSRQSRALAEMHRVLRPGGRLVVSDLCITEALPDEILRSPAAFAG